MKHLVLALAALAAASTSTLADESVSQRCYGGTYVGGCTTTWSEPAEPIPLASKEEIAKWEAFCKPERRQDSLGVYRFVYAQRGCDLGRTE